MEAGRGALARGEDDAAPEAAGRYRRHSPEQTLLFQIITQYYPALTRSMPCSQCARTGRLRFDSS
jgi:hypothetical protein